MKTLRIVLAALCCAFAVSASAAVKPGILSSSTIVYSAKAETEEGSAMAEYLNSKLPYKLAVADDANYTGKKAICFVHSENIGLWEYSITYKKGNLVIDGGSCWAMQKAADIVAEKLANAKKLTGFSLAGTVEGEFLFPIAEGADLRILDDNIWDYSKDTIPPVWKEIGYDCRDCNRGPQYAQLVRAYMPDVYTMQEYNRHMDNVLLPLLQKYGYAHTDTGTEEHWNNTPILYNTATLEMVDALYCLYTPERWSNHGSKSYTWAVFKRKSDGKTFAVLNTHLWWKGDKAQPGSTEARASQVCLMIAEAKIIKAKYNCPIFVTGDMNCEENTLPIRLFLDEGFVPCYKAATVYGNLENGHHICAPGDGYSRVSRRKGAERSVGAIDHCFIWNAGETEVLVFDCLTPYFTVPLTDHYPNLIDARL